MHNIQIENMCKWALHKVNQSLNVYTSNSLYKRPVLEPDVLTQIASIQKNIQIYINLQKKRKKKLNFICNLKETKLKWFFKQKGSLSRKILLIEY